MFHLYGCDLSSVADYERSAALLSGVRMCWEMIDRPATETHLYS